MQFSFRSRLHCGIAAAILFLIAPVLAQETPPPDPPNGFSSQERGALRLSYVQVRQLKVISAAHLPPFYPKEAAARGQVGKAKLDLLVDASGAVVDARVLEEDPLAMGFGEAAAAATKTSKFWNPFNRLVAFTTTVRFAP